MAMTNAERQAKHRAKQTTTHRTIEIVLERTVYDHLQILVKTSGQSRQDFISELIQSIPLQNVKTGIADEPQKDPPPKPLPVTDSRIQPTLEPKQLWLGVYRCQSTRNNGKPCRIETNLVIVSFTFHNQVYQAQSCQQHKDSFAIHSNYF